MIWIYVSTFIVALISTWLGYKRWLYWDQINLRNSLITAMVLMGVFMILQWLHWAGYFPEAVAGAFMANMYASLFGFFTGAAIQQYLQKVNSGKVLYVNRSFWTDILPGILALALILFGIQRTSLFSDVPLTPIRLSSGLSIMAVGFYSLTIRLVPEFREKAWILIDRKISWKTILSYSWYAEGVLEIEYKLNGKIRTFKTMISPEDEQTIEHLLSRKIAEKLEEEKDSDIEIL